MVEQGLLQRPGHGDLRDLIARRFDEGAVVTVGADDTLQTAYGRMKLYDVSQVPVLEGDRCVGLLDESDLLVALTQGTLDFKLPVKQAMAAKVETVSPDTPPENLLPLFNRGMVAVVVDGEHFLGLITRIDLLNHLRRKLD
jgi:cystathionine beta-synthase